MPWLIPITLMALAFTSWRLSFRTDDRVVAWCRWTLAVVLLGLAVIAGLPLCVHWVAG